MRFRRRHPIRQAERVVPHNQQHPPLIAAVLVILAAVGMCTLAVGIFAPTLLGNLSASQAVAGGGGVALVALIGLWMVLHRRDRTLW